MVEPKGKSAFVWLILRTFFAAYQLSIWATIGGAHVAAAELTKVLTMDLRPSGELAASNFTVANWLIRYRPTPLR